MPPLLHWHDEHRLASKAAVASRARGMTSAAVVRGAAATGVVSTEVLTPNVIVLPAEALLTNAQSADAVTKRSTSVSSATQGFDTHDSVMRMESSLFDPEASTVVAWLTTAALSSWVLESRSSARTLQVVTTLPLAGIKKFTSLDVEDGALPLLMAPLVPCEERKVQLGRRRALLIIESSDCRSARPDKGGLCMGGCQRGVAAPYVIVRKAQRLASLGLSHPVQVGWHEVVGGARSAASRRGWSLWKS